MSCVVPIPHPYQDQDCDDPADYDHSSFTGHQYVRPRCGIAKWNVDVQAQSPEL